MKTTVQELIDQLMLIEDKSKSVTIYDYWSGRIVRDAVEVNETDSEVVLD